MPIMSIIIAVVVTLIVAVPITYFATVSKLKSDADSKIGNADTKAREIIDDALKTAEAKKKEALLLSYGYNAVHKGSYTLLLANILNRVGHFMLGIISEG